MSAKVKSQEAASISMPQMNAVILTWHSTSPQNSGAKPGDNIESYNDGAEARLFSFKKLLDSSGRN